MYSQLSRSDGGLDLAAGDRLLRFPAVWLRDNCPCAECVDPASKQKLKDITDIPNGTVVTAAEDAGESVVVTFAPDRHRSTFTRSWLAAHALGSSDGGDGRTEDDKDLWLPADLTSRLPEESCGPGRPGQHPGRAGQEGRLCPYPGDSIPRTPPADPPRGHEKGGAAMTAVEAIGELFAGPGARDYLGEPVTIGAHMRQAGALAEAAGADPPLVAAALLHDVGHLRSAPERRHGEAGARWLSRWFGEGVTEPVRLHVAAKRYLCAAEPGYLGRLSAESVRTLALQGGPMSPDEAAAFEVLPHARGAVAVRRWDDEAKDPAVTPPGFGHFAPLLEALARS